MNEPPLWKNNSEERTGLTFRLLFLPNSDHPSSLRLAFGDPAGTQFIFTQLDGAGGYEPGEVETAMQVQVDPAKAKTVASLISRIKPFSFGTPTQVLDPEFVCLHGTQIVFEFRSANAYKAISRDECELDKKDLFHALILAVDEISEGRMILPGTYNPR